MNEGESCQEDDGTVGGGGDLPRVARLAQQRVTSQLSAKLTGKVADSGIRVSGSSESERVISDL